MADEHSLNSNLAEILRQAGIDVKPQVSFKDNNGKLRTPDLVCKVQGQQIGIEAKLSMGGKLNQPIQAIAQAVAFTDVWEWGEAADARLARITQGHMSRHHPLFPVRHAKKSISALNQFLPQKGMLSYLTYMAERLAFCHALLKETGSIYLHCDPTASHYLKMVMDDIFGAPNFRNEIVWCYNKWTNACKYFQRNHDIILFYTKSDKYTFNKLYGMTPHKMKVEERGWDSNKVREKGGRWMDVI